MLQTMRRTRSNRLRLASPLREAPRPRRIVMIAFPGAQTLDVIGPLEVFSIAARLLEHHGSAGDYTTAVVAASAGPLTMSSGLRLVADHAYRDVRGAIDTLLVAGGEGTGGALADKTLLAWLRRTAPRVRRLGSVCT